MTEFRNSRGNLPRGESPYFIGRPKLFSPETGTHLVKNHNEVLTAGRREHVLAHSPIRSSNQSNSSNHTSFSFPYASSYTGRLWRLSSCQSHVKSPPRRARRPCQQYPRTSSPGSRGSKRLRWGYSTSFALTTRRKYRRGPIQK